jgi:integrase
VVALQAWLDAAAITEGRVFWSVNRHGSVGAALSDQTVALIIKRRAAQVDLDSAAFSGHSLGAGLATAAAAHAVEAHLIQRQTRHRSVTVLRSYIRDGEMFVGNASGRVGL